MKSNRKRKQETKEQADPFLIEMVDRLPFVAPVGVAHTFEQRWTLAIAACAAGRGSTLMAMVLIGRVQRELGVSISDQVAAIERAAERVGRKIRAQAEQARDAQVRRAEALNAPLKAAAPDEKLKALKAACEAKLAEANAARLRVNEEGGAEARDGLRSAIAALRVAQAELDAAKVEASDAEWSQAAVAESVALEVARDDEAEIAGGRGGAIRVRSRDGLAELFEKGRLSENEWRACRAYRGLYESAAGIGSQMASGGGAGGASALLALRRAQRLERLRKIERIVYHGAVKPPVDPKTGQVKLGTRAATEGACRLKILREVVGEGRTLRSCATGARARARAAQQLVEAAKLVVIAVWEAP